MAVFHYWSLCAGKCVQGCTDCVCSAFNPCKSESRISSGHPGVQLRACGEMRVAKARWAFIWNLWYHVIVVIIGNNYSNMGFSNYCVLSKWLWFNLPKTLISATDGLWWREFLVEGVGFGAVNLPCSISLQQDEFIVSLKEQDPEI